MITLETRLDSNRVGFLDILIYNPELYDFTSNSYKVNNTCGRETFGRFMETSESKRASLTFDIPVYKPGDISRNGINAMRNFRRICDIFETFAEKLYGESENLDETEKGEKFIGCTHVIKITIKREIMEKLIDYLRDLSGNKCHNARNLDRLGYEVKEKRLVKKDIS